MMDRYDGEYYTEIIVPTTFRAVAAAGIVLDAELDGDDLALLDAPGYVRAVARVEVDYEGEHPGVRLDYRIDVRQVHIADAIAGEGPDWVEATPYRLGWRGGDGGPLREANRRGAENRTKVAQLFSAAERALIKASEAEWERVYEADVAAGAPEYEDEE